MSPKLGRALQRAIVGRGAAYGDFDNDGDLDLLITANNGPARLLRNDNANQNDMLRVKLVGTRSNRDGIGARVLLKTSKGVRQFAMVKTGSSYLSQSELPTLGLGKPEDGTTLSLKLRGPADKTGDFGNQAPTVHTCRKPRIAASRLYLCGRCADVSLTPQLSQASDAQGIKPISCR